MPRILFTTPTHKIPDLFDLYIKRKVFRLELPVPPFGIRFLKANIPEIETLEYPAWEKFTNEIKKGVDILGISFFMKDVPMVKKMIEFARQNNVKEIWGGGYGILCDDARTLFDRSFVGYAEKEVAQALNSKNKVEVLKHPYIEVKEGSPFLPLIKRRHGILFTSRGCNIGCVFCQTPAFVPEMSTIPLESIEEILRQYKAKGIRRLYIPEENFLLQRSHDYKVIDLMHEYGLEWGAMTRADFLKGNARALHQKGCVACTIGIESIHQEILDSCHKKESAKTIIETIEELAANNITVVGTYILGWPDDTEESIKEDVKKLAEIEGIFVCQFFVLTPFPHTPLYNQIKSRYGIFEKDHSKFNCRDLVWNHPHITPPEMEKLVRWSYNTFFSRRRFLKHTLLKAHAIATRGFFGYRNK